jgi:hypothetical protein
MAGCPVSASATATQLESRGHTYSQPARQPATTAPLGQTASLRSSKALVAMDR